MGKLVIIIKTSYFQTDNLFELAMWTPSRRSLIFSSILLMLNFVSPSLTAQSVELFNHKDLTGWIWHDAGGSGPAEVKNGELHIQAGDSVSGVIYENANALIWKHYEISLETKLVEGTDFFCGLTFPIGDAKTCVTLVLGGWGGSVTGISSINGMDAAENSTGHYRRYKDQEWYRVRVLVTPKFLKVFINDTEVIVTDVEGQKFDVRPGPIEEFRPLSLTTYATTGAFKNLRYTNLEKATP